MTIITKPRGILAFVALTTISCGAYDSSVDGDPSETLNTETQELWKASWSPTGRVKALLGVARTSAMRPYAWFDNGSSPPTVCYGDESWPTADTFCGTEKVFTAPLAVSTIRGIAIKQDNSRVVAWYANTSNPYSGWYSAGTATNLASSTGLTVFTPAAKPGGGVYNMANLIDVDHNGVDGRYYYYWASTVCTVTNPTCSLGRIYRTVGSLTDADAYSAATEVTTPVPDPGMPNRSLVGVSIFTFNAVVAKASYFIGYYHDGFVNISTSSINLNQP